MPNINPSNALLNFHKVSKKESENAHWQLKNAIKDLPTLARYYPIPKHKYSLISKVIKKHPLLITPYYFSLINIDDPEDPIAKQVIPTVQEINEKTTGFYDPLDEEKDSPVDHLIHRYPDRVLMNVTNQCAVHCRFCNRRRLWTRRSEHTPKAIIDGQLSYITSNSSISEIIISGGDPFLYPEKRLIALLRALRTIPHIEVIRIHTRVPVVLPQRITRQFADQLKSFHPLWINTHFNHPRELTPSSQKAINNLIEAGIPLGNQSVLLKGVNDDLETIRSLVKGLIRFRIRPYYLFVCDPVSGATHFATSIGKAIEIYEGLQGHISGYAVPKVAIDGVGGAGKIPISPNYMLSQGDGLTILRNYEGVLVKHKDCWCSDNEGRPEPQNLNLGVSKLIAGEDYYLMPEKSPRLQRRKKKKE